MKSSLSFFVGCTLAVAIAAPLRVEAQNEADFKGKTIRIVIGTSTGGGVDLYARLGRAISRQTPAGRAAHYPAEYARRQLRGRRQLCLHSRQARRLDPRRFAGRRIFRSDPRSQHGEVRLVEVHLDRFAGTVGGATLHARRQSVQNPRRRSARQRAAALRRRRHRRDGVLCAESIWKKPSD